MGLSRQLFLSGWGIVTILLLGCGRDERDVSALDLSGADHDRPIVAQNASPRSPDRIGRDAHRQSSGGSTAGGCESSEDGSNRESEVREAVADESSAAEWEDLVSGALAASPEARCGALRRLGAWREKLECPDEEDTRRTIVLMSACLTDEDMMVRDAAFEAMQSLPEPERQALSLQVLGNEDTYLKLALLDNVRDSEDDFDLTLNFHALDCETEVKARADENLRELFGFTFETSEEAFEWWASENENEVQGKEAGNEQLVQR